MATVKKRTSAVRKFKQTIALYRDFSFEQPDLEQFFGNLQLCCEQRAHVKDTTNFLFYYPLHLLDFFDFKAYVRGFDHRSGLIRELFIEYIQEFYWEKFPNLIQALELATIELDDLTTFQDHLAHLADNLPTRRPVTQSFFARLREANLPHAESFERIKQRNRKRLTVSRRMVHVGFNCHIDLFTLITFATIMGGRSRSELARSILTTAVMKFLQEEFASCMKNGGAVK